MKESISKVGLKYAKIDRLGRNAIYKEGVVPEFNGFPESLGNRFNTSLIFDADSVDTLEQRLMGPVANIVDYLGMNCLLAGRDFTLHSTLLEGLCDREDSHERQSKFGNVANSPGVLTLANLIGNRIEYKYLLIDKGNLILTAIDIPEWVIKARDTLAETYRSQGLRPLEMANILHISVSRITHQPRAQREETLREYAKRVTHLRHNISSNPMVLKISRLSARSSLSLLTEKL